MSKGRKVMRLAKDDKFDEAVYQCFFQKRSLDMPISGPILCVKALQLHERNLKQSWIHSKHLYGSVHVHIMYMYIVYLQ